MADAFLIGVAKSLGSTLASFAQDQVLQVWGVDLEVEQLKSTMSTINALLKHIEERPGEFTSPVDQDWLAKLQDAVYAADDVFDEIVTSAKRKEIMEFGQEVKLFFSPSNQLFTSFSIAQRVKSIRENLDQISKDHRDFGVAIGPVSEVVGRGEINLSTNVVGRDIEKAKIIDMLLDTNSKETVCVIPIVGLGGIGKSTLARLVFDDKQVQENFQDMRLWVTLPQHVTLKGVIEKIIAASGEKLDCSNHDLQQSKVDLSGLINGKKYLLVLDNVWSENAQEWRELDSILSNGAAPKSRVLSTTRSHSVAEIMGTVPPFELQGLDDGHSWSFLESIVFGGKGCHDPNLKEIGLEILGMCHNVPLAIQALANVLATTSKSVSSWMKFQKDTLSHLASSYKSSSDIMPILQLSYDHLSPSMLKSCFSYCSLFPRGHEFVKDRLIALWSAQGFIEPLHKGQSLENDGAEYLDMLVNKGLLQQVPNDESGIMYKLHDLMHDLSCTVASKQCQMVNSNEDHFKSGIYHISVGYEVNRFTSLNISNTLQGAEQLRTFLLGVSPWYTKDLMTMRLCKGLMKSFPHLRVLDLHKLGIKKLPKSLGMLIHLRYLDLSNNDFRRLPNSTTLLHNLRYLDLSRCYKLTELPIDTKKLVNLRHLLLEDVWDLRSFPPGLEKLSNLETLSAFVLGSKQIHRQSRLSDLKCLNNLRGNLKIKIGGTYKNMGLDAAAADLRAKTNLKELMLEWDRIYYSGDELVLDNLQPPTEITRLHIRGYEGVKLPKWMARDQITCCLQHLEDVCLQSCENLKHIPPLSKLPNLKSLWLENLNGVEYMEDSEHENGESLAPLSFQTTIFPSLMEILMFNLPNFKGWKEVGAESLSFPRVSKVTIWDCKRLESMPSCPNLEELDTKRVGNVRLLKEGDISSSSSSPIPKLKRLSVDNAEDLASLPRDSLQHVSHLDLGLDDEELNASELGKGLEGMTSLKSLALSGYHITMSDGGLPLQLGTLERLKISWCDADFPLLSDGDQSEEAWKVFNNLHFLELLGIRGLKVIPRGIRHLTTLQSLELFLCTDIKALPDWIGDLRPLSKLQIRHCHKLTSFSQEMTRLTALKLLVVEHCPELARRCQRDTGDDWHKIRHVQQVIAR